MLDGLTGREQPKEAEPDTAPLRTSVLSGHFFGTAHTRVAERLAAFLHGGATITEALLAWFGEDAAALAQHGPADLGAALDADIAAIDNILSEQLDTVIHAGRFQALEGRWRGLAWLLNGLEPSRRVKVRVLSINWAEICRDLERALEFDQSTLFRRIHDDEFGIAGGEPFGLLVIDHAVRHRPAPQAPTDDVGALQQLSSIAAAAFCPMVLSLHPAVLEVEDFAQLAAVQDITAPLRGSAHARWRGLSARSDMRFIGLAMPRLLARHPWKDDPARADGFRYREHAPDIASRTWMSASYAFAACAMRAFLRYGWPADVRGVETDRVGGGLVTDLPPEPFASGPATAWPRAGLELRLSDRQERALVNAGVMPVSALPFGPDMAFSSVRSMQAPATHTGTNAAAADANARLSAQLNSILCAARFAHHIKIMGRDMVGSFQTADAIERRLQIWLQGYVDTNISSTGDSRARYPLVAGDVQVRERAGHPGVFSCVVRLQPHYQLDDVATVFNLVTELAATGAR
ncbi:type VI secretion system contractile sheath large subunit [Roseomonas xinghualingensis]|uniref:type VI secretion system contractile sheath large subunit n=1 Tax=Roseomonas xinghualingensis TaxID=2986475 RepID=UPI0021F248E8|nr:type VI secretion system contractile sheath large subunit [Roseomonas sp. SXEYE001]MCV4209670.1 type VI secretion system contractile sheath large subunit [Roseomonas sp. SXEYE001]